MERGWDCGEGAREVSCLRWACPLKVRLVMPRQQQEQERVEWAEYLGPALPPRTARDGKRIGLLRRIK